MDLSSLLLLFCGVLLSLLQRIDGQDNIRPINGEGSGRCETLTSTSCANIGYNSVFLPNPRGHQNQTTAEAELSDFAELVATGCSDALSVFLCSYYFPLCYFNPVNNEPMKVPTCRSLCEFVRLRCEPTLISHDFPWPLFWNCSLGDFSDEQSCFGPVDPANLSITEADVVLISRTSAQGLPVTTVNSYATPMTVVQATSGPLTPPPPPQSTTNTDGSVSSTARNSSVTVARAVSHEVTTVASLLAFCTVFVLFM